MLLHYKKMCLSFGIFSRSRVLFCMKEGRMVCFIYRHTQHILIRLYGVGHMIKNNSDSERRIRCRHIGYSFRLYFSFLPVLHDWCNKGRGMCYPVCGMVRIKEPLPLIGKSSLCGGSGFPFSLSELSLTMSDAI